MTSLTATPQTVVALKPNFKPAFAARRRVSQPMSPSLHFGQDSSDIEVEASSQTAVSVLQANTLPLSALKVLNDPQGKALYQNILEAQKRLAPYCDQLRGVDDAFFSEGDTSLTPLSDSRLMEGLHYKREDQTVMKAYKVRGAMNAMLKAMAAGEKNFVVASTGNHALATLMAAKILKPERVTVVVPRTVSQEKWQKLQKMHHNLDHSGTRSMLVKSGDTFEEARAYALRERGEAAHGGVNLVAKDSHYIDPYADPDVVAGQGTLGLELLSQMRDALSAPDAKELVVTVPVGGGGLFTGVATAVTYGLKSDQRLSHVKPTLVGVRLADLDSPYGDANRVEKVEPDNLARLEKLGAKFYFVDDSAIEEGLEHVFADLETPVEGAAAEALVPVLTQSEFHPDLEAGRHTVSVLSGGNVGESVLNLLNRQ